MGKQVSSGAENAEEKSNFCLVSAWLKPPLGFFPGSETSIFRGPIDSTVSKTYNCFCMKLLVTSPP